jgi:ATP-GRASP peptide maturase of grasp-with-spasm system
MILILSSKEDQTTNTVMDWLTTQVTRLNGSNAITQLAVFLDSTKMVIEQQIIDVLSVENQWITAFWYRRDDLNIALDGRKIPNHLPVKSILEIEWAILKHFLHYALESIHSLGSFYKEAYHNKLISLRVAQLSGLAIPATLITTKRKKLQDFKKRYGSIITKAVGNMFLLESPHLFQSIGTHLIEDEQIECLEETIAPTLVQQKIEKSFELRIFFIQDVFYAMAIFSQLDEKTALDYRNYNRQRPNRNVPYQLPDDLKAKLKKFVSKMELNTGSIDLIVSTTGEYIFLEVNPIGQFGWLSLNCNYYLESKIAHYLENKTIN